MQKLKGIKILRNKGGKARYLVIDIDKHYDVVENLIDVLEVESRLQEKRKPAEEVYREIEKKSKKKAWQMNIYSVNHNIIAITILKIAHRSDAYKF